MYIRYIVFTKYIRLIYLLETIDKKDLPPLQLTKADKCIFLFWFNWKKSLVQD